MKYYTRKILEAYLKEVNESCKLIEPNGYGNYDRFTLDIAYGGCMVSELEPHSTGHRPVTYGYKSARETVNEFNQWLLANRGYIFGSAE